MTFLQSGVAGLYTIATIPEARNRGIAGELTRHALLSAQGQGYRAAALQASRMGFPVYQRLGFQTCASFDEYEWAPTSL
jgi:ribosomal protein S18 acetylase RimI-like enzyme